MNPIAKIDFRAAGHALTILLLLQLIFHVAVVAGVLPQTVTWGGFARYIGDLTFVGGLSLLVFGLSLLVVRLRLTRLGDNGIGKLLRLVMGGVTVLFVLGSVLHFMSAELFEKTVLALASLATALLSWRLTGGVHEDES